MDKNQKEQIYGKMEQLCNPYYLPKGFARDKKIMAYEKDGLLIKLGASSEHFDSINIQPGFRIGNDSINKILKKVFPQWIGHYTSKRTQGSNFAHEFGVTEFDNSQFNFVGEGGLKYSTYSYSIEEDADLTPIIEDHINFMEKVGFKYFEALSSVKGINEYFNSRLLNLNKEDFSSEEVSRSFQKEEILSAIVAAHLEKDKRYNEIVERYKKLYSEVELYLQDIEKLTEYIASCINQ